MYKAIEITTSSGMIYVTRLKNNVGEVEIVKAVSLSNTGDTVVDIGLFSERAEITPDSVIVLIASGFDANKHAETISKLHPGIPVQRVEEFSAYSDEYELKHRLRSDAISSGFDYAGLNFQIDAASRINIMGKVMELQLDPSITEITWISNTKDATGNDILHTFTREDFVLFAIQVANSYESIILNK